MRLLPLLSLPLPLLRLLPQPRRQDVSSASPHKYHHPDEVVIAGAQDLNRRNFKTIHRNISSKDEELRRVRIIITK